MATLGTAAVLMGINDGHQLLVLLCLLGVIVGIIGVVVPVLPGLLLCLVSVLIWAIFGDAGWGGWLVFGLCAAWVVLGIVVKYAWPGKRLKDAGVPNATLLAGIAGGLVGMFVIPVVGLVVGFVAGVWLAEWSRHNDPAAAWPSTKQALLGAGLAMLVELTAATFVLGTFVIGLVAT